MILRRSAILGAVLLGSASARAQSNNLLPPSPFPESTPQKLTPPPPPPWDEPLSTSGIDVTLPTTQPMVVAQEGSSARLRELERRVEELEHEKHAASGGRVPSWIEWLHPSMLLQPQLIWNVYNAAASPNAVNGVLPPGIGANDVTATSSGNTTNPDFLRLRRARLRLDFLPSEYARFILEIEPMPRDPTIPGSGTIARQIEAIARFPVAKDVAIDFGGGSFEVPLGAEWREHHGDRPFIERSWFQQNLLPGDFDLGFHVGLNAGRHFEAEVAVVNGQTFGQLDHGGNLSLGRAKDFVASARFVSRAFDVGASGYAGEGQLVDGPTLRFKQYLRFAGDVDLAVHAETDLGRTRVFVESILGSNMDRGVLAPGNLPVIPADITQDVQDRVELGGLVRVNQDLGRFFTVAARYDFYVADVNLDSDVRHTISAVLALRMIPELVRSVHIPLDPRIQLNVEYDHAIDTIRAAGPTPATKLIDTVSVVLQGRL